PTLYASDLTGDELKVYEFVVRRFLACCSDHAVGHETTIEIKLWEEKFTAKGMNYLDVYPYDRWGESNLPNFQKGETFIPTTCEMREGRTSPPEYLTEADLISIMDQNGIEDVIKDSLSMYKDMYIKTNENVQKLIQLENRPNPVNHVHPVQPIRRPFQPSAVATQSGSRQSDHPKCQCGLYAASNKTKSPGVNHGRPYFSCPKAGKKCNFFQWADGGPNSGSGTRRTHTTSDGN
ncbi:3586_t:CDS:2, partial [Racocetra fulgida]